MTKVRRRSLILAVITASLVLATLAGPPAQAAPPQHSRSAMSSLERDLLPDALGEVTKAGTYLGVPVVPGDILLPPESPDKPTTMSKAALESLRMNASTGGIGAWFNRLFGIGTAHAACGDTVVLHGSKTDVDPEQIYDYRKLGAIGEDTCDKIQAYYRQRLVDVRDNSDVATYHVNNQIVLRHEDWDTGGDGCGYKNNSNQNVDGGPCYGSIDPDDIRGSEGDSPATYYIRGGAFHNKGAQDRWQTYGQYDYVWYPLYDRWSARQAHCSDMWRALSSITYPRTAVYSGCLWV